MAKSKRIKDRKKTEAIITDRDGNAIIERGKIYESRDDGLYEVSTEGGTVVRKKVMGVV